MIDSIELNEEQPLSVVQQLLAQHELVWSEEHSPCENCRYNQVQDIRSMIAAYQDKPVSILGTKEYPDMGIPLIRHTAIGDAIVDAYDVALARSTGCLSY